VPALVALVEKRAVIPNPARHELCMREALRTDVEGGGASPLATVLPGGLLVACARVAAGTNAAVLLDHLPAPQIASGLHLGLLYNSLAPALCYPRLGFGAEVLCHDPVGIAELCPGSLHFCAAAVVHSPALIAHQNDLRALDRPPEIYHLLALLVRVLWGRALGKEPPGLRLREFCLRYRGEQNAPLVSALGRVLRNAGRALCCRLWLGPPHRAPKLVCGALLIRGTLHRGLCGLCSLWLRLGGKSLLQSQSGNLGVVASLLLPGQETLARRVLVPEQSRGLAVVCPRGFDSKGLCCGRALSQYIYTNLLYWAPHHPL